MFLKKLDILSPYITLYFKGERKHSSKSSGILSLISYIFVLLIGVYYIIDYINKKEPKAYFYNRYAEDAGNFPLNSSMMFNFIQICDQTTNSPIPFDYSVIRVIGSDDVFSDEYMNDPNVILNRNHWIYGYCENIDSKGLEDLIDYNHFYKSSCIKKYYNKNTKQYYNAGENGFRWPILEKGCSHPNRTYYGIIMQRCDKVPEPLRSQGVECKSESEISEKISKISLKFEIIDNFADILNYTVPLKKYLYEITSAIVNGVYIVNHLNFNPVNMVTNKGFIFNKKVEELSFIFLQNEKHTVDSSTLEENETTNGCLIGIYFWMQNTLQYYERVYDKFQDILSDIGGVYSIVKQIAYIINLLIHNFIILLDTEDLIIIRDKNNVNYEDIMKKPTILRKANKIIFPPKKRTITQKQNYIKNYKEDSSSFSRSQKFLRNLDTMQNPNFINDSLIVSRNIEKNNNKENLLDNKNNIPIKIIKKESNLLKNNEIKKPSVFLKMNTLVQEKNKDLENRPIDKQNFTCVKYFWYLINFKSNNKNIAYYETFRAKLISEENIVQIYLDVYKLNKSYNLLYDIKEEDLSNQ